VFIRPGAQVEIQNIAAKKELNGLVGRVVAFHGGTSGRWEVTIKIGEHQPDRVFRVKEANLIPVICTIVPGAKVSEGALVLIQGIESTKPYYSLNGKVGKVREFVAARGRWVVDVKEVRESEDDHEAPALEEAMLTVVKYANESQFYDDERKEKEKYERSTLYIENLQDGVYEPETRGKIEERHKLPPKCRSDSFDIAQIKKMHLWFEYFRQGRSRLMLLSSDENHFPCMSSEFLSLIRNADLTDAMQAGACMMGEEINDDDVDADEGDSSGTRKKTAAPLSAFKYEGATTNSATSTSSSGALLTERM